MAEAQANGAEATRSIYPLVVLAEERQRLAGLAVIEARLGRHYPEFTAFGQTLDIEPLLALRLRYLQAKAERSAALARHAQSQQSLARIRELVGGGIAAKRRLLEQQSQWQADKSLVDVAVYNMQAIVDEARLNWGQELANRILSADVDFLDALVSGRTCLLQITLHPDQQLPDRDVSVVVDPFGHRENAQSAVLIAPSPKIDQSLQGRNYFFQTSHSAIKPGMNVSVWIRSMANAQSRILIPRSAVFWSMGETFVYLKSEANIFERRLIRIGTQGARDYLVESGIMPGELVVTTGAHVLWSEENRKSNQTDDD